MITGGSDGLGFAMARALLKEGARVALAARPGSKLDKAVGRLQNLGFSAYALPLDVRSQQSVAAAVDWVKKNWGRLDLLVNNAGIGMGRVNPHFATRQKAFYEIDTDGFRDVVETNFIGYFLVAKGFVPLMIDQGKGRIVNISSSFSTMVKKSMAPYGPARAASEALSNVMTEDLREYGIAVNVLLPGGPVDTGLLPEESREAFQKSVQLLDPDIMAKPIVFLASPQAQGITGERIIATEFLDWLKEKGYAETN